jgi:hypothetical protein
MVLTRQQFEKLQNMKLQESTATICIDTTKKENNNSNSTENIVNVVEYEFQATSISLKTKNKKHRPTYKYKPYSLPPKRFTHSNKSSLERDKKLLDSLYQCSEREKECTNKMISLCDTTINLVSSNINDLEVSREPNSLFCRSIASALREMPDSKSLECKHKILQVILDDQSISFSGDEEL